MAIILLALWMLELLEFNIILRLYLFILNVSILSLKIHPPGLERQLNNLRALAALPENLNWVSITHSRYHTSAYNSSSRAFDALLPLQTLRHIAYILRDKLKKKLTKLPKIYPALIHLHKDINVWNKTIATVKHWNNRSI